MMTAFLQEALRRFSGDFAAWHKQARSFQPDSGVLDQAVEHVVDKTSRRLRAIRGYRRRLEGPVTETFLYIDNLVERMPGSFLCSRSTFNADPRVKAFFVSPRHLQEVFSLNRDVRELFDENPLASECCALVCMRMEERQKFGVAVVGDRAHREVMQTMVSFKQHQVYSPGTCEAEARQALKCCILDSVLASIRQRLIEAKVSHIENRKRLSMLRDRLRKATRHGADIEKKADLQKQIEALENTMMDTGRRPPTIEDHLVFVADVLRNPGQYISAGFQHLHLTHMGIKVNQESREPAYELDIAEIRIATKEPRVAALVRFPRGELLPKTEFLSYADSLFPA